MDGFFYRKSVRLNYPNRIIHKRYSWMLYAFRNIINKPG